MNKLPAAKEAGFVLSIDQASNIAGISLWKDGLFIRGTELKSANKKDSFGARLVKQIDDLDVFLDQILDPNEEIKVVLFEGVRSRLVLCTVGAFCCSKWLQNCKVNPRHNFIESSRWKRYCKARGVERDPEVDTIKGLHALRQLGWDFDSYPIESNDIADSVIMYKAWAESK